MNLFVQGQRDQHSELFICRVNEMDSRGKLCAILSSVLKLQFQFAESIHNSAERKQTNWPRKLRLLYQAPSGTCAQISSTVPGHIT